MLTIRSDWGRLIYEWDGKALGEIEAVKIENSWFQVRRHIKVSQVSDMGHVYDVHQIKYNITVPHPILGQTEAPMENYLRYISDVRCAALSDLAKMKGE